MKYRLCSPCPANFTMHSRLVCQKQHLSCGKRPYWVLARSGKTAVSFTQDKQCKSRFHQSYFSFLKILSNNSYFIIQDHITSTQMEDKQKQVRTCLPIKCVRFKTKLFILLVSPYRTIRYNSSLTWARMRSKEDHPIYAFTNMCKIEIIGRYSHFFFYTDFCINSFIFRPSLIFVQWHVT